MNKILIGGFLACAALALNVAAMEDEFREPHDLGQARGVASVSHREGQTASHGAEAGGSDDAGRDAAAWGPFTKSSFPSQDSISTENEGFQENIIPLGRKETAAFLDNLIKLVPCDAESAVLPEAAAAPTAVPASASAEDSAAVAMEGAPQPPIEEEPVAADAASTSAE